MGDLHRLPIAALGCLLRARRLSAVELVGEAIDRVCRLDPRVHAFIVTVPELALIRAERADREMRAGIDRGPLHGIPYALKDIIDVRGLPTTCNSKLREGVVATRNAAVETRLRNAGGVLLGKVNTHEFALGGPSFDLPFPPSRNPWNLDHFTGASSSGSAAAVAAGFVRLALGSDTGGSIRSPAANCGVVGLKPTFGLVSRRGLFPLSYSLDHCGPIAGSVADVAASLGVIAGPDRHDPASVHVDVPDYRASLERGARGLRVGYARDFFAEGQGVSAEVVAAVDRAAELLVELGATVEEVSAPDHQLFKACQRIIMTIEAFAIHETELRDRPRDFGRYTYQRLVSGGALSGADLVQAQRLRRRLTLDLNRLTLSRRDVLLTGATLAPAAPLQDFGRDWPPPSLAVAAQTPPCSITGNPALVMPCGFSESGLPLALQLIGRPFDEATVIRAAQCLESALGIDADAFEGTQKASTGI